MSESLRSLVSLGDVLNLRKEVVHPSDMPKGPTVFVGLEHVESGTGRRIGRVEIEKSELSGRKPAFREGDIVYGYLRPYLNKVWVAEFDGLCSVDQYVYSVNGDANAGYIAWFLRSSEFLRRAPIAVAPGQLPRIRTEEVASVQIHLPGLSEQIRVAAILDAEMRSVHCARTAAEAGLDAASALVNSILVQAFAHPGCNVRLGDLADGPESFADGPFGSHLKTAHYTAAGARVIRLQNIGRGRFLDKDKAFVDLSHFESLQRHSVLPDDVLVAALGDGARPAGRACVAPANIGPSLVKADCFRVRLPKEKVRPRYLMWWLNSPDHLREIRERKTRGATRPRFTLSMMQESQVPLPPPGDQDRIVEEVEERLGFAEQTCSKLLDQIKHLEALPGALLRRAFRGEV